MTPDTAAWRTLADAALRPLLPHMDFRQQVALDRARKDAARALCDAADEVERLRANGNGYLQRAHAAEAVVERLRCVHCGEVGCDWIGDIRKARAEMAEAERDAARDEVERLRAEVAAYTAPVCACGHYRSSHTPLDFGDCAECPNGTCAKYPGIKWDVWHRDTTLRAMRAEAQVASRTAHAALVAELRAKVAEARTWRGYKTRDIGDAFDATTVTDLLDDLTALLDRHAPTLTTTED